MSSSSGAARQWGRVVPLQPLSTRLTAWFITAIVAAIVTFLFFAQYARKETVTGYLTPASGTARVLAPQAGTVSEIYVEQGQRVEDGQPLMAVTISQIATSGEDVNAGSRLDAIFILHAFVGRVLAIGGIDVLTAGCDLANGHGHQRLAVFNALALLDIDLADSPGLRRQDPRRAGSRRRIAGHRLLAGVLREEER